MNLMLEFNPSRILWSGGLNSTSVILRLEADPVETVYLYEETNSQSPISTLNIKQNHVRITNDTLSKYGINHSLVEIYFSSLSPDTEYRIYLKTTSTPELLGKFQTFPTEGTPYSFTFSAASCAKWQSSASDTYLNIFKKEPRFFISTGDLFYGDISSNDFNLFIQQYLSVLQEPTQKSFFSQISTFYIFDDHDFANNDSNGNASAKNASLTAFDHFYPHYPLYKTKNDQLIGFQVFTVGRVRFIITDLRSQSTGPISNLTARTTLGETQRELLLNELRGFQNHQLMVWISTKPWNGANYTENEEWSDYSEERSLIANEISMLGVNNLVMIAGDAHMLAADDGSNSDFSTNVNAKGAGFPIYHSAPMAQYGSVKGGAYSIGCYAYLYYPNYQYSIFTINDSNSSICLKFEGFVVPSTQVLTHTVCRETSPSSTFLKKKVMGTSSSFSTSQNCKLPWFPTFVWVLIALAILLIVSVTLIFFFRKKIQNRLKQIRSKKTPSSSLPSDTISSNVHLTKVPDENKSHGDANSKPLEPSD